ncbi:hypothetical protein M8J76_009032 [Diaphorina citri]|nr:hypothetical protein M8J76_009032 [Diaphorina citri]
MEDNLSDDIETDDAKLITNNRHKATSFKQKNLPHTKNMQKTRRNSHETHSYNNTSTNEDKTQHNNVTTNDKTQLNANTNADSESKTNLAKDVDKETGGYRERIDEVGFNYSIRSTVAQITVTLILNFLNFNYGMVVNMPTLLVGTLDYVTATNETILMLFHPVGAMLSGHLQELVGRKTIMLLINVPFLICWVLLYSAGRIYVLYVASIVMGISLGCCEAPVASYIGEISEPKLRGAISLLTGFASSVGALVIYVLYTYTSWRYTFLLSAIIPSISLMVIGFLPESPAYWVSKHRFDDARKSLMWLRGWIKTEDPGSEIMTNIEGELKQLIDITNESNVLYINTKVKRGYHLDNISSDCFVHNDETCLIEDEGNKRASTTESIIVHTMNHVKCCTSQEYTYAIEGIAREMRFDNNNVDSLMSGNTINRNVDVKVNGRKLSESSRQENFNNALTGRLTTDRQVRQRCCSQNFTTDENVDVPTDGNSTTEEPAYYIVKVKHPKTIGNLVRYTMRNEEIRRPLIMVLIVMCITTIASLSPIRPFLMEIIQTYDDTINTDNVLIGTSILNILGFFLCAVTINRLGKRRLVILSLAINAVVSFTLGYFAYTHVAQSRIPIYCIYVNCFLQGYGILQLPWILMSEVFPLEIRGIACGLCAGFSYLLTFFFTKTYLTMTSMFGLAFTIYFYSATGVVGILYIYFFMPETENKTLHQIQRHFLRR